MIKKVIAPYSNTLSLSLILSKVTREVLSHPFCTKGQQRFMENLRLNSNSTTPLLSLINQPHIKPRLPALSRYFHRSESRNGIVPFLLADIGEGITECEIVQWFVNPGDKIAEFDKICEVQSDKASVEITSRYSGVVLKLHYNVGQMAKVGKPIVDIETEEDPMDVTPPEPLAGEQKTDTQSPSIPSSKSSTEIPLQTLERTFALATPAVRRIARENHIDITKIIGTGKGGRISKEDVLNFAKSGPITSESLITSTASLTSPVTSTVQSDKLVPLTNNQKSMFKSMTKALQIPHFGYSDEYSVDNIISFRNTLNEHIQQTHSVYPFTKVSFMPFFIKSFSTALLQYPILNACLVDPDDPSTAKILYRSSHNIGIAMDTPSGLIVPNIKNVQTKSILDIASELVRLQEAGKRNAIPLSDFKNGTITLSNIGIIGGTYLSPVLVCSELCIAAIGKVQRLPRFEMVKDEQSGGMKEKVVAKNMVKISLSADHRVIDGATVARFSEAWKNILENPVLLAAKLH